MHVSGGGFGCPPLRKLYILQINFICNICNTHVMALRFLEASGTCNLRIQNSHKTQFKFLKMNE